MTTIKIPERPALRKGCSVRLQEFEGKLAWVLEDPVTGSFFRVGTREREFLERLDGEQALVDLLENAETEAMETDGLDSKGAMQLVQRLASHGLLESPGGATPRPALPFSAQLGKFNPLFLRASIGNPDRFFETLVRVLSPILQWWLVVPLLTVLVAGAYQVFGNWQRFQAGAGGILSAANSVGLLLGFVMLKLVHEMAHGLVCKRLGGRVADAGVYLIFFVPLTYIDATACWRFPSRRRRILVSVAGIVAELFVAAVAALVWAATGPSFINSLAYNMIITATVVTLLFNANPLMRFDGYFVLADLSNIPNLYARASRAAWGWIGWAVLGMRRVAQRDGWWIPLYGLACLVWRVLLIGTILVGAVTLLHGAGLVLALVTLVAFVVPTIRRLPNLFRGVRDHQGWPRMAAHLAVTTLLVAAGLQLPVGSGPRLPSVVEAHQEQTIRVSCPGFVSEVFVHEGQQVAEGDRLLEVHNPEESARLGKLVTAAKRSEAVANIHRDAGDYVAMTQEQERSTMLSAQAEQLRVFLETRVLRAPADGVVQTRDLDFLAGRYLETGMRVMAIGDAQKRRVRIALPEKYLERARLALGDSVDVLVPGRAAVLRGRITLVESTASRDVRYPVLTALAGGELDVVAVEAERGGQRYQLVDPHFYAQAELQSQATPAVMSGERGITRHSLTARATVWQLLKSAMQAKIARAVDGAS